MFQPIYVAQLFGDAEMRGQGFLSSILAAAPTSLAGTRLVDLTATEPEWVRDALADYNERLAKIVRAPLPIDPEFPQNGLTKRRHVTFSPRATELYWKFYNHIEAQQGERGTLADIRGFAGKTAEMAARLAVTLHIFQHGVGNLTLGPEMMAAGVQLMNFYLAEALRLAAAAPDDPNVIAAEAISDWLKDVWQEPEVSIRAIRQSGPNKIRKLTSDQIRDLCLILERHDHITKCPAGGTVGGARAKEAWRVNVGR